MTGLIQTFLNGLIRQYLPKGTDLSVYSQEHLDAIAYELSIRPRKRFDFKCPIEDLTEVMAKQHEVPASIQVTVLHSASEAAPYLALPPQLLSTDFNQAHRIKHKVENRIILSSMRKTKPCWRGSEVPEHHKRTQI